MYSTALKELDLNNKCGTCKNYKALIKKDLRMGFEVNYCHGTCKIKHMYKQRTETCKKYVKED